MDSWADFAEAHFKATDAEAARAPLESLGPACDREKDDDGVPDVPLDTDLMTCLEAMNTVKAREDG